MKNASQLLVECLENEGVEYIFGIPGEEMVFFLDALRESSIRFITTADERGASFMAAAYGRLTGRPGVVATTLGPGALNIPNGLAFATLSGFPMVALTWQSSLRTGYKDNGFQYVDTPAVFTPISKHTASVTTSVQIPEMIRNAFRIAQSPKCGACHIQMYEDVSEEEIGEHIKPLQKSIVSRFTVDALSLQKAVSAFSQSRRPMVLAGLRACSLEVSRTIQNFIENTGAYLITTPMAQGILPSDHAHSLFSFVNGSPEVVHDLIKEVDVVLSIGYDPLEYSPSFWNQKNTKVIIHIDEFSSPIHRLYVPDIELIGAIDYTLSQISQKLKSNQYHVIPYLDRGTLTTQDLDPGESSFPIRPEHLVSILRKEAPDARYVHDNGMHKLWMTRYFHPDRSNQVLVDNTLASMGSGISQAIVAKLLHPEDAVVVNIGDGGLLMSMGELATVAALNMPLIVLVWNDSGYGMIRWHQGKNNLDEFGVSLTNPDFVKIAESFGGVGLRIRDVSELESIIQTALQQKKLTIIDCPIDYSQNPYAFKSREEFIQEKFYVAN